MTNPNPPKDLEIIDTLIVRISKSVPKQDRPMIERYAIKQADQRYIFTNVKVVLV